jgi:hypothetical protein
MASLCTPGPEEGCCNVIATLRHEGSPDYPVILVKTARQRSSIHTFWGPPISTQRFFGAIMSHPSGIAPAYRTAGARSRLAFLVPYIGPWPRWAPLFFASVACNPLIDVILLCEVVPSFILPPNVFIHPTTRADLTERLRSVTGLPLSEVSGHKLCDFKPFYGLAFADLLEPYEFWGYCDVDLIFGDLSGLLTSSFFENLDVFSAHNSTVVGHFTIIRNSDRMNRVCFTMDCWREACASPLSSLIEEGGFALALGKIPNIVWKRPGALRSELAEDFCRFGITFVHDGAIYDLPGRMPGIIEVRDGKVFFIDTEHHTEILYAHFMGLKRWWHWIGFHSQSSDYRLSSIGYGGPAVVTKFDNFPWKHIWLAQILLLRSQVYIASILRRLLPSAAFLFLRRQLSRKGRY